MNERPCGVLNPLRHDPFVPCTFPQGHGRIEFDGTEWAHGHAGAEIYWSESELGGIHDSGPLPAPPLPELPPPPKITCASLWHYDADAPGHCPRCGERVKAPSATSRDRESASEVLLPEMFRLIPDVDIRTEFDALLLVCEAQLQKAIRSSGYQSTKYIYPIYDQLKSARRRYEP